MKGPREVETRHEVGDELGALLRARALERSLLLQLDAAK